MVYSLLIQKIHTQGSETWFELESFRTITLWDWTWVTNLAFDDSCTFSDLHRSNFGHYFHRRPTLDWLRVPSGDWTVRQREKRRDFMDFSDFAIFRLLILPWYRLQIGCQRHYCQLQFHLPHVRSRPIILLQSEQYFHWHQRHYQSLYWLLRMALSFLSELLFFFLWLLWPTRL